MGLIPQEGDLRIGDRVLINHHPDKPTGKVTQYDGYQFLYEVRFDNEDYVPKTMWYARRHLNRLDKDGYQMSLFDPIVPRVKKCTCGVSSVDTSPGAKHSNWCDLA